MSNQGSRFVFGSALSSVPRSQQTQKKIHKSKSEVTWETQRKSYLEGQKSQVTLMAQELERLDRKIAKVKRKQNIKKPQLAWQSETDRSRFLMKNPHNDLQYDDATPLHSGQGPRLVQSAEFLKGRMSDESHRRGVGFSTTLPTIRHGSMNDVQSTQKQGSLNSTYQLKVTNMYETNSQEENYESIQFPYEAVHNHNDSEPIELPIFSLPVMKPKTPPPKEDLSKLTPTELKRRAVKLAIRNQLNLENDDDETTSSLQNRSPRQMKQHHHHTSKTSSLKNKQSSNTHSNHRRKKHVIGEKGQNGPKKTSNHQVSDGSEMRWLREALEVSELTKSSIIEATRTSLEDLKNVKDLPPPTSLSAQIFLQTRGFTKMKALVSRILLVKQIDAIGRWKQFVVLSRQQDMLRQYMKHGQNQKVINLMKNFFIRFMLEGWLKWISFNESEIRKERFSDEDAAVRLLQNIWRGKSARKLRHKLADRLELQRQNAAAMLMQKAYRGKLARRGVFQMIDAQNQLAAAKTLQCFGRGYLARKELRIRRARLSVVSTLQRRYRGQRGRRRFDCLYLKAEMKAAAASVQRMFRGGLQRRRFLWALRRRRRKDGAVHIQRCYRGKLGRRIGYQKQEQRDRKVAKQHKMATKIQRRWRQRGFDHEKAVLDLVLAARHRAKVKGTIAMQSALRRSRAKKRVKKLLVARFDRRMECARAWVETWHNSQQWVFINAATGEERFGEPPYTGYTKSNGNLVLETGEVVDRHGKPLKQKEAVEEIVFEEECQETEEERKRRLLENRPICAELIGVAATRWDVIWDEPFSEEGWVTAHTLHKVRDHPYCRIHEDGSISPRAINSEGEDEGVYEPGCGGRGLLKARKLAALANPNWCAHIAWAEMIDADGNAYWVNEITGEASYTDPNVSQAAEFDEYAGTSYVEGDGYDETYEAEVEGDEQYGAEEENEEWTAGVDEEGNTYWYNNWTGESTYEDPTNVLGNAGEWVEGVDEEDVQNWYNETTGETTYEDPNAWGGEEEWVEGVDEQGVTYWYNETTGETAYDAGGEWVEGVDEEGGQYWYNETTGETTYEDPNAWGGEEEWGEEVGATDADWEEEGNVEWGVDGDMEGSDYPEEVGGEVGTNDVWGEEEEEIGYEEEIGEDYGGDEGAYGGEENNDIYEEIDEVGIEEEVDQYEQDGAYEETYDEDGEAEYIEEADWNEETGGDEGNGYDESGGDYGGY